MKLYYKAFHFAYVAHKGVFRKYTGLPYFIHCDEVSHLVGSVVDDENMICAALLHDVVEDTKYEIEDIEYYFNDDIAYLVNGLTDVSKPEDGNRAKRKEMDRNHIASGCSRIKTIKLADLINNTDSILEHDPKFAKTYMAEKKLLLNVLTEGNKILYNAAKKIVDDYYNHVLNE